MEAFKVSLIGCNQQQNSLEYLEPGTAPDHDGKIQALEAKIADIDTQIEQLTSTKDKYLRELATISDVSISQKVRNQSVLIQRISFEKKSTQILDVINEMKKGTQLLKYGEYGSPHYHQFELSADNLYLRWYSKKKKKDFWRTVIKLDDIIHLQSGHLYKQELADARKHERAFSICFQDPKKNQTRTLEVIAKNKTDFQVWTKGLDFIIKSIKSVKQKGILYDAKTHFPAECFLEIHRRNQEEYEMKLAKKSDPTKKAIAGNLKLLLRKYTEVMKSCQEAEQHRNSVNYSDIDSILMVKHRLAELHGQIQDIEQHFNENTKKWSILIYQMYDAMVELKALHEKLIVVVHCNN